MFTHRKQFDLPCFRLKVSDSNGKNCSCRTKRDGDPARKAFILTVSRSVTVRTIYTPKGDRDALVHDCWLARRVSAGICPHPQKAVLNFLQVSFKATLIGPFLLRVVMAVPLSLLVSSTRSKNAPPSFHKLLQRGRTKRSELCATHHL